jgi:hypothetical protein
MVKNLFGLLGKSEKMTVDDIWAIKFDKALNFLNCFINEDYQTIENLYKK